MIQFDKYKLANGLKVLIHTDSSMPIVAANLLYNVGAKHEDPTRTGFAHLFEHLMFSGSKNAPNFDEVIENAGGENNAFTNNDITNYYILLPKDNLETALWVESDRMQHLTISQKSLDIQKSVVIEEFNQRYLNQPYGDAWLLLRPLAYTKHPYQWATIGKSPEHIANATLNEVKEFYINHYAPNNAILSIAGDVQPDEVMPLVHKWFDPIPSRPLVDVRIEREPKQLEARTLEVERDVPYNAIYKVFHMGSRLHKDYPATDLISDILSNGKSSRLFQNLVKKDELFSAIDAYITGDMEEGLFVISGRLNDAISFEDAENAILNELQKMQEELVSDYELDKVKNKFESNFIFALTNAHEKALGLCQYELLGDAQMVNQVVSTYREVQASQIRNVAQNLFLPTNGSTLYYKSTAK